MRKSVPDRAKAPRARASLRKLAAGVGIALVTLLHAGAASPTGAVPAPGTARFVDRGGPVLHAAQVHLLYWGSAWPTTGRYFPTPGQITAAFQRLLAGPYLSGLAEYRGIRPAVLLGAVVVTSSQPHSGFNDDDVANFLNAQLDAGVVPGPDPHNQTLYIVVLPVGISAGGYRYEFDGEHDSYERHGQRIHVVWAANSGSLDGATRIISHELVESVTDPEGSAIRGASGTCDQGGWCEIADVCFDTDVVNGVAVSPYWSEHAHACVTPRSGPHSARPDARTSRGRHAEMFSPGAVRHAWPGGHAGAACSVPGRTASVALGLASPQPDAIGVSGVVRARQRVPRAGGSLPCRAVGGPAKAGRFGLQGKAISRRGHRHRMIGE